MIDGNGLQLFQLYDFNCSNGAKIQVKIELENKRKTLAINFLYRTDHFPDYSVILHWGIVPKSKSKWIQPLNCLFLSNGATPEKNDDGISCKTDLILSDNRSFYFCKITLDLFHFKSSHKNNSLDEEIKYSGTENCENSLNWLNGINKEWGISFVLYSIPCYSINDKSAQIEKLWIKDKDKCNSDFFIPIGSELLVLEWMELIISENNFSQQFFQKNVNIELDSKNILTPEPSNLNNKSTQLIINGSHIYSYNEFTTDNNCIWVISSKICERPQNEKLFALIIYTNICSKSYDSQNKFMFKEYELILHFGFTKSTEQIDWASPYKYLKEHNLISNLSEIDERSIEANFIIMKKYSKCELTFPVEILKLFKGFVFVVKLKPKKTSKYPIKWLKSENNKDFMFKLPYCEHLIEKECLNDLSDKDKKNDKIWELNLKRFINEAEGSTEEFLKSNLITFESIITNKMVDISEDLGKLHALSALQNENSIIKLRTFSKRKLVLHCGLLEVALKGKKIWKNLPNSCLPLGLIKTSEDSTEIEMPEINKINDLIFEQEVQIKINKTDSIDFDRFVCVFKTLDENGHICWHKEGDKDIEIAISFKNKENNREWEGIWSDIVFNIISAEVEWGSITLMHRYNLMDQIIKKWSNEFINETYKLISDSNEILWYNFETNNQNDLDDQNLRTLDCENVKDAILRGEEFWAWIMIWMRFNSLGVLDWQRNYNTAPRLLAHSAETASLTVISKWVEMPKYRCQIRLIIQSIIRGGSRGQEVRDRILHIMHKNHIPENHGTFYEQWHQKLHNNTTPDDVGICRSIIGYLRSNGNEEVFSKILHEEGLSWERIRSYDRPITAKPYIPPFMDVNALAFDFEQYLEVLVDVHEALNLQRSFHYSREYLDEKSQNICASVIFGESKRFDNTIDLNVLHDRLMSVNKAREEILNLIYNSYVGKSSSSNNCNYHAIKEIMYLDLGLENLQCMFIQTICTIKNNYDNIMHLVDEMNSFIWILFGHDPCNKELEAIFFDWKEFKKINQSTNNYILILKSLIDRLQLFIGSIMDKIFSIWDPKVTFFGTNIGLCKNDPIIKNFMDEILRSTLFSTISLQIKRINKYLLNNTDPNELNDWQFISYNPKWRDGQIFTGVFKNLNKITDLIEDPYKKIVSCSNISGEEDIPMNVIGIILTNPENSPDLLSHLSVRARNMNVLLVVCQNSHVSEFINSIEENEIIDLHITNDMRLEINKNNEIIDKNELIETKALNKVKVKHKSKFFEFKNKIKELNKWVLLPSEMDNNNVGQKALNLVRLKKLIESQSNKLPFFVPSCVSLPFGTLNKLIKNDTFEKINSQLNMLEQCNIENPKIFEILESICNTIEYEIEPCDKLLEELINAMKLLLQLDLENLSTECIKKINKEKISKNSKSMKLIWEKIKKVWMSVYQPISFYNMKKIGLSLSNVYMSIAIQRLMNAKYAFVLHSKNPIQNKNINLTEYDEMYGELVIGLGETLVSNTIGKSMGFTALRKKNCKNYQDAQFIKKINVVSFPSKSIAMLNQITVDNTNSIDFDKLSSNFIFRSDSNAEDIEGFAGAGVFQSIPLIDPKSKYIKYLSQQIITDYTHRNEILKQLATISFYIQDEFDQIPQDIEGCIIEECQEFNNKSFTIAIVQSRPQV
ncbi:alpha-glucan water dikinase [Cryptosporidium ubiquitum]|uniref:Alpha-glucan water dikinase n=1 Tax=Cryptosporidium ubiquitum TaxID=857276 RepID=A0A1J4MFJ8_9CRYT|nr:alpha-glucan water dikinase [Cryptosporidium ubiquitum]OII71804.1 alpha-glucan water dikinase [Cryptosporidium ubiquitum]